MEVTAIELAVDMADMNAAEDMEAAVADMGMALKDIRDMVEVADMTKPMALGMGFSNNTHTHLIGLGFLGKMENFLLKKSKTHKKSNKWKIPGTQKNF